MDEDILKIPTSGLMERKALGLPLDISDEELEQIEKDLAEVVAEKGPPSDEELEDMYQDHLEQKEGRKMDENTINKSTSQLMAERFAQGTPRGAFSRSAFQKTNRRIDYDEIYMPLIEKLADGSEKKKILADYDEYMRLVDGLYNNPEYSINDNTRREDLAESILSRLMANSQARIANAREALGITDEMQKKKEEKGFQDHMRRDAADHVGEKIDPADDFAETILDSE